MNKALANCTYRSHDNAGGKKMFDEVILTTRTFEVLKQLWSPGRPEFAAGCLQAAQVAVGQSVTPTHWLELLSAHRRAGQFRGHLWDQGRLGRRELRGLR